MANSDLEFIPEDLSSEEGEEEEEQQTKTANRKRKSALNIREKNSAKKAKKNDKNPIKSQNHNDFFINLKNSKEMVVSSSDDESQDEHQTDADNSNGETALNSMLVRQLEHISNQMNRYAHDMSHLQNEMNVIKRLIVKVEVLIKLRKESTSSDLDVNFLNTLQSYGLPIDTKEKLDALEKKLKNGDDKSKLVRVTILFINIYWLHL